MIDRLKALQLLSRCRGDEIWPIDLCLHEGVPAEWIEQLEDCTESGFNSPDQTLYTDSGLVNQFRGVQDLKLAYRIAEHLGVNTTMIPHQAFSRTAEVQLIKEAVEEM